MEAAGLILGTAQVAVQIAGVIKRHVLSLVRLRNLADSIEAKAVRSCVVAEQLSTLAKLPGISSQLFEHTFQDLLELVKELAAVEKDIERWGSFGLLALQAPVITRALDALDAKLTQIDHYFRTVGTLGSMIFGQQAEMRDLILSVLYAFLSASDDVNLRQRLLFDFEERYQCRTPHTDELQRDAEFAFAMGLTMYDSTPDKVRIVTTPARRVQSAARFFKRACDLGKKEAFRYFGDIYYDGKGADLSYLKAVDIYEQGVARDDPGSMFALAWCYEMGHGVSVSANQSLFLLEKAAWGGCGEAIANMGILKLRGKLYATNLSEAARLLKKALKMGVFAAKESLAGCYQWGIGVDHDPVQAFELFSDAFNGGDLLCTVELANCYDTGFGVEKNLEKATEIYRRCMRRGTWERKFFAGYYGLRLILGHGIEKNVSKGKEIIIDSTKSNSAYGWHALAECYRYGLGFKQNTKQAKDLYLKAINCGNGIIGIVDSYLALASMFESGEGLQRNLEFAHRFYVEAANRLSPSGQWKAGLAFESGIGTQENVHRAVFYFEMCANSGNRQAQRKYVTYYMKGHGVERSRMHSKRVIEEAARSGNRQAKQWLRRERSRKFGRLGFLFRVWSV